MPLLPDSVRFVFFDLGQVLLAFDWAPARARVAAASTLPPDEVDRRFRALVPWTDFELGRISGPDFFDLAARAVLFRGTSKELSRAFCDIFKPLPDNLALAEEIAAERPGATGILSNTNPAHIAHIEENHPEALASCALRLYSHQLGLRKPQPELYRAAAEAAHTAAGNILFIDDLEENVRGAEDAGWQTIYCPPLTDLRARLKERLGSGPQG